MRLEGEEEAERCVLVIRVGSLSYGIIVDRVFDTEEIVVKPTASVLRAIPFYSGATILGDGAVIMILDPKGVAQTLGAIDTNIEETHEEARSGETLVQLLIMRGAGATLKAAPLQLVSRIEGRRPKR